MALTLPASLAPRRLAIRRPPLALPGFVLEAVLPKRLRDSELHRWVVQLLHGATRREPSWLRPFGQGLASITVQREGRKRRRSAT